MKTYIAGHRGMVGSAILRRLEGRGGQDQTASLRDRLAQNWNVGRYRQPFLQNVMNRSVDKKMENTRSDQGDATQVFTNYAAKVASAKWTVEDYNAMHERLVALDIAGA